MNLESVIQSTVSQKEKNKYIFMYIYSESRNMVQMNLLRGRIIDADKENGSVDTVWEGECGTNRGNISDIYTLPCGNR